MRPTAVNAERVLRALRKFGAPLFDLKPSDLARPGLVLVIGVEPVRVDLLTSIDGVSFEQAWKRRVTMKFGKTKVPVLSAADLAKNKRRVGRPQDVIDASKLEPLLRTARKKRR